MRLAALFIIALVYLGGGIGLTNAINASQCPQEYHGLARVGVYAFWPVISVGTLVAREFGSDIPLCSPAG